MICACLLAVSSIITWLELARVGSLIYTAVHVDSSYTWWFANGFGWAPTSRYMYKHKGRSLTALRFVWGAPSIVSVFAALH